MTTPRSYAVAPLAKASLVSLVTALVLLPLGVLAAIALEQLPTEPLRILQAVLLSLLPAAILVPAMRRRALTFDGHELVIKTTLHTRRRTLDQLDLDGARIVDLGQHKELRPMLRTFGAGVVGFRSGHYRLRNWQRAFVMLTRRDRVLALPEHEGTLLLLSVERPQQLLDDLRAAPNGVRVV